MQLNTLNAMPDYSQFDKSALQEEIKKRRAAGADIDVDLRSSAEDLIAALELDDSNPDSSVQNGTDDKEKEIAELKAQLNAAHKDRLQAEQERDAALAKSSGIAPDASVPDDLHLYKGEYKHLGTGEVYGLRVLPKEDVRSSKTHLLKNRQFFWEGTQEQFRKLFEKQ